MIHSEAVAKLTELLALPKNWDSYGADPPNEASAINAFLIFGYMVAHKLEADGVLADTEGGIGIVWVSEFNKGHRAHIQCTNEGTVTAVSWDDDGDFKFWWVSDFNLLGATNPGFDCPDEGELQLNIQETLEYIRHYIWANHDTV